MAMDKLLPSVASASSSGTRGSHYLPLPPGQGNGEDEGPPVPSAEAVPGSRAPVGWNCHFMRRKWMEDLWVLPGDFYGSLLLIPWGLHPSSLEPGCPLSLGHSSWRVSAIHLHFPCWFLRSWGLWHQFHDLTALESLWGDGHISCMSSLNTPTHPERAASPFPDEETEAQGRLVRSLGTPAPLCWS